MYHYVDVSRFFAVRKALLLTFPHLTINTGTSTNIAEEKACFSNYSGNTITFKDVFLFEELNSFPNCTIQENIDYSAL